MSLLELFFGVVLAFLEGLMWFSFGWAEAFGSCLGGRVVWSQGHADYGTAALLGMLTLIFWGAAALFGALLWDRCRRCERGE